MGRGSLLQGKENGSWNQVQERAGEPSVKGTSGRGNLEEEVSHPHEAQGWKKGRELGKGEGKREKGGSSCPMT